MKQGKEITISIGKANLFSFVVLLFDIVFVVLPYFFLWKDSLYDIATHMYKTYFSILPLTLSAVVVVSILLLGIVLHEFLHGFTWSFFTKNGFKDIRFGVKKWILPTPYCHCTAPMKNKYFVLGVAMPFLILGLIPSIAAMANGNFLLLFFGMVFVAAASGDIFIAVKLLRENPNSIVKDHPDKVGCNIYADKVKIGCCIYDE
ncbi:MAG: DUF3267 domain-containing protein [Prevotellaceae bacterium]|jgi:hypothetical protein|nr:DUF3267 domain-containing protein [Prevotellaceae bacterium]